jgi:hypothetical protein
MARIQIVKKDGTPSRYFWSDSDGSSPPASGSTARRARG